MNPPNPWPGMLGAPDSRRTECYRERERLSEKAEITTRDSREELAIQSILLLMGLSWGLALLYGAFAGPIFRFMLLAVVFCLGFGGYTFVGAVRKFLAIRSIVGGWRAIIAGLDVEIRKYDAAVERRVQGEES